MNQDLLTVQEAANLIQVSPAFLRKIAKEGQIQTVYISSTPGRTEGKGGRRFYPRQALDKWMQDRGTPVQRLPSGEQAQILSALAQAQAAFHRLAGEITKRNPELIVSSDGSLHKKR